MMNWLYGWCNAGWWMSFGFILWILFWGVILYFLFTFLKDGTMTTGRKGPIDILKERYAKGEITKEQFEEVKKDIQ